MLLSCAAFLYIIFRVNIVEKLLSETIEYQRATVDKEQKHSQEEKWSQEC